MSLPQGNKKILQSQSIRLSSLNKPVLKMTRLPIVLVICAQLWAGVKGGTPYSFDYLLASDDFFSTSSTVVFLQYDLLDEVYHKYQVAGKTIICIVNVGSWEFWREDANLFPEEILGNDLDGWPGEKWLDITKTSIVVPLMRNRFQLALSKGCSGIAADNMIGYNADSGFEITYQDQLIYNRLIASEIHVWGLLAGLNNNPAQADDLINSFDFAVAHRCVQWNTCDLLRSYVTNDKPVFDVEFTDVYDEEKFRDEICPLALTIGFSFNLKHIVETADIQVFC